MNLSETAQLLTMIAAFSNRNVEKSAVIAWQSVLGDVDLADAEEAVRQHYAEHTEWIMPAHIRTAVRDMVNQREMAARATGWAPGQHGVPKDQPLPEITGPTDWTSAREQLQRLGVVLPEGSREALMPRRVAWEREQKAFVRSHSGEPNPLYKPSAEPVKVGCEYHEEGGYGFMWDCGACRKANPLYKPVAGSLYDAIPDEAGPERDEWLKYRGWDSYEQWQNRDA